MQKFLSVSELNAQLKAFLREHFSSVCVEGEICNFILHPSGHSYFSLKDAESSVKCVLFKGAASKLKVALKNDLKVQIKGEISLYEKRGEYQIICSEITLCGANISDFNKIKAKLDSEGLFDKAHKKPLPKFPHKIALITSRSGAALQDILFVANKRWNLTRLTLFNTLVQGENAKFQIAESIARADSGEFDIIVLARGGGSFEDLWAFNEEIVARTIFSAKTPIVSAIGHEIDFLISDFVADVRAPTPSAAMEMILPERNEWLFKLVELRDNLSAKFGAKISALENQTMLLKSQLGAFRFDYKTMSEKIAESSAMLQNAMQNIFRKKRDFVAQKDELDSAFSRFLAQLEAQVAQHSAILESRNPKKLVEKGFVQITKNSALATLKDLQKGDILTLSDGNISKEAEILG